MGMSTVENIPHHEQLPWHSCCRQHYNGPIPDGYHVGHRNGVTVGMLCLYGEDGIVHGGCMGPRLRMA
jgi:hypothetical protein